MAWRGGEVRGRRRRAEEAREELEEAIERLSGARDEEEAARIAEAILDITGKLIEAHVNAAVGDSRETLRKVRELAEEAERLLGGAAAERVRLAMGAIGALRVNVRDPHMDPKTVRALAEEIRELADILVKLSKARLKREED